MDSHGDAAEGFVSRDPLASVAKQTDSLSPTDPRELGDYHLIARLGEGGMGIVYLGCGPGGHLVAVKVVRAHIAGTPELRSRFRREAEMARRVARFCTAEVLDVVDPPDGPPYLVTEFVDGPTLEHAVGENGPLGSADLERVAVSVAAALTAIHGAGLVHRDLKPANVLLSPFGPRVIDFGIAQAADSSTVSRDAVVGTPAFMAPEQARGEVVTCAADIFAWGGLVVFAGTGRLPFGEGTLSAQLYRVVHTRPILAGLDPALAGVVKLAMRRDPGRRPSAEDLFRRLVLLGATPDACATSPLQVVPFWTQVTVHGHGHRPGTGCEGTNEPRTGCEGTNEPRTGMPAVDRSSDWRTDSDADPVGAVVAVGAGPARSAASPGDPRSPAPTAETGPTNRDDAAPHAPQADAQHSAPPAVPRPGLPRPPARSLIITIAVIALLVLMAAALYTISLLASLGTSTGLRIDLDVIVPAGLTGMMARVSEAAWRTGGFLPGTGTYRAAPAVAPLATVRGAPGSWLSHARTPPA